MSEVASEIVTLTNQERAKQGLSALAKDSTLMASAKSHTVYMFENNSFKHTTKYNVGENIFKIAATSETKFTAAHIVASWMASSGHRANILNPDYTRMGAGVVKGQLYNTQLGRNINTLFATQHFSR
jgi:uncharacterized protein YkwD